MCSPYCYCLKKIFVSRDRLATTFRWEENKLTTMHKIQDLSEIIPNTRGNDSAYRTRNNENYTWPKCRLDAFKKYFVPDTIHLWNSVSLNIRREISVNNFKTLLSWLYQKKIYKCKKQTLTSTPTTRPLSCHQHPSFIMGQRIIIQWF